MGGGGWMGGGGGWEDGGLTCGCMICSATETACGGRHAGREAVDDGCCSHLA